MSFIRFQGRVILLHNVVSFYLDTFDNSSLNITDKYILKLLKNSLEFPLDEIKDDAPILKNGGKIVVILNQLNEQNNFICQHILYKDYQDAKKEYEAALAQLQKSSVQKN